MVLQLPVTAAGSKAPQRAAYVEIQKTVLGNGRGPDPARGSGLKIAYDVMQTRRSGIWESPLMTLPGNCNPTWLALRKAAALC